MMQKTRPIEAIHQVLGAFKLFEKKLDKLQEDVNTHGHALSDLRTLVSSLTLGMDPKSPQLKLDDRRPKKSTAVQYDNHPLHPAEGLKTKRKNTIQSLPPKGKQNSLPVQSKMTRSAVDPTFARIASVPKVKHTPRPGKTGSQRKAINFRGQKGPMKRNLPQQQAK